MSYFPSDIPYMTDNELEEHGINVENNKENVMTSNEIINKAFKLACQYLQYNAPSRFVTYEPDEIQACYGSVFYEDGWRQWAKYFLYKVESNTDTDLVKMLREEMSLFQSEK